MPKKTKTQIKEEVQDLILRQEESVALWIDDQIENEKDKKLYLDQLRKQIKRVEKLFGY